MKFNTLRYRFQILAVLSLLFFGCKDDEGTSVSNHDPSKPVEIKDFNPKKGGARTRLYIKGSNFGNDINNIFVKIGGMPTKVIGSTGEILYCMVPFKAKEGTIEVKIGAEGTPAVAQEKFLYEAKTIVGTVAGYVDETGKVEVKDGTFEEAGFSGPGWITVDPIDKHIIYVTDGNSWSGSSIRKIDTKERKVTTLLTKGEGNWENIRCTAFSTDGNTMYISNQQNVPNAVGISYVTRENGFKKPQTLINAKMVNTIAVHPNGELYYNNRDTGEFFRYDFNTKSSTKLEGITSNRGDACFIFIHPTGDYAYIVNGTGKVIYKSIYNKNTKTFDNQNIVCGVMNTAGWLDGQGTNARLANPIEGVFVKNNQYVEENKTDVYDFYFGDTATDGAAGHCIRILTPEAFVSTYAGRGSQGVDNNPYGYVDGDLRLEARFNYPMGLYYDDENKIFYVGDVNNYRIRDIKVDE